MSALHIRLPESRDYVGELAALASAVSWAGTSVALSRLGDRYPAALLSALRLLVATPLLLVFLLADGAGEHVALAPVGALVLSGLVGYGVGDTTFIRALPRVGIQRMVPTTTALWVAMSAAGGVLLLDERVSWGLLIGGVAVVGGCALIVRQRAVPLADAVLPPALDTWRIAGVMCVVAAAWAGATLLLASGRGDLSVAAAGAIRIPAGGVALALFATAGTRGRGFRRLPRGRDLALILAIGVLGTGLGSWLYIYAVAEAGAARAVVLNATSPLMALPLSMLLVRERPTRAVLFGTILCVAGTVAVLAR